MKNKISVQLYTLREACQKDFPGVLRELASIGYGAVEFAGYNGYDPAELKAVLAETGLRVSGMHCGVTDLLDDTERVISEARMFDTVNLICTGVWGDIQNEDGYRTVKRKFNELAGRLQAEGLRISYHNHAFEFDTIVDGVDALSYLLEPAPDNFILGEPDVYWLKKGGARSA